jgi:hypothetical protein
MIGHPIEAPRFVNRMRSLGFALFTSLPALLQTPAEAQKVDATTMEGKVLFGYQGWFNCPVNGSGSWVHWSRGVPQIGSLTVDMYPDLTEFQTRDLCAAGGLTIGGEQAYLFSSRTPAVVNAHFKWMQQYGLDGVLVQRFIGNTTGARNGGDVVLKNIVAAAEATGRAFAIEYDLTGGQEATFAAMIQTDWKYMVDNLKITSHPNYLHHNGKPVVSLWGPGINDGAHNPKDPAALQRFIDWFRTGPEQYRANYMGGTPAGWGTMTGDSYNSPAWAAAYASMDIIQPWTVGRYADTNGAKGWSRTKIAPDVAKTKANGKLYMPVIFPGFSWANLKVGSRQNQIPRHGGRFLWSQAHGAKAGGASMLKIAMFDEVDEGTAMFKLAPKRTLAPDQGYWLTLDADGHDLPSDWYLRLAGEITRMFHGERPLTATMPSNPGLPNVGTATATSKPLPGSLRAERVGEGIRFRASVPEGPLEILDPSGRTVRTISFRDGLAVWDGRRESGRAEPGVYLARVSGIAGARAACRFLLP